MTKLETIEILAILGGFGALISPTIMLAGIYWLFLQFWFIPNYLYSFGFWIFVISFITGILALIMTIRAASFVSKMPQRAASDLKAAGIMVIVVSFLSLINWLLILSGVVILIAGIECDAVWKKIRRARNQTGWPFVTVATAAGSNWARRLSCRFCGAPLVAKSITSRGHLVKVNTQCPLDYSGEEVKLPLSRLESWVSELADRLHRCIRCGNRTAALLVSYQNGFVSRLQAFCPNRHRDRTLRTIWTPLYPHVARAPAVDIGFQGRSVHPRFRSSEHIPLVSSIGSSRRSSFALMPSYKQQIIQPIPISSRKTGGRQHLGAVAYCSNCGVHIDQIDRYCFRCGTQIR